MFLYVTHATRALKSNDLSGEGISLWLIYVVFWPHKDMEGLSGSAQCRGHLRDSTNMKDYTHQAHTQSFQQGEYEMMIMAVR